VRHAKRCFEALIGRWLVMPVDVSAAGKVKSCMVDGQVHDFITKIATKEHILDARLSHLRARHFSIFSGLRLRASDSISTVIVDKFSEYLHQLRLLKLLDLEDCHSLDKKHLRDICRNILQLKYLSLRGTHIADLPSEINNLHELEVLDIRETNIPESATRGIVLLKLQRLLAGSRMDSSKIQNDEPLRSRVQIPQKINKMDNMEVLSNVIAYSGNGAELKEIRKLAHLRKLGVVIDNKEAHLENLLWAISDLKECIQSLSITILATRNVDTHSKGGLPSDDTYSASHTETAHGKNLLEQHTYSYLITPPKALQSLSLDGSTSTSIVRLLPLFAKGSDELEKVTLRRTFLNQEDLSKHLSSLPKLLCIRLRYGAYREETLTIKENEFLHLKNFLVDHLDKPGKIKFEFGAAPKLEKIVLCNTEIKQLCGVGALSTLKELELKGNKHLVILSSPGEGTASDESVTPEDGRARAKPVISEDGRAPADQILSEDRRAPARKTVGTGTTEQILPEDGTGPAKPITPPYGGTTSNESTTERTLSFNEEEFKQLKYFLIEGHIKQTNVKFDGGAPELEKIVLDDTNIESLVGVCDLAKLREIYLKGTRTLFLSLVTAKNIVKITLSDTNLKKDDLKGLAQKEKLCSLELLRNSYDEDQLTFDKDEFPELNILIADCSKISKMSFAKDSACKIEKIIWTITEIESLSGIGNIQKLKELEFNVGKFPLPVRRDISAHHIKLIHNKLPPQGKQKEKDQHYN
jgi:hypothetical protein